MTTKQKQTIFDDEVQDSRGEGTDRRRFVKDVSLLTAGLGLLSTIAKAGPVQDSNSEAHAIVKLDGPLTSLKVLYFDKKVDDGTTTELACGIEAIGSNDVRSVSKAYLKKVDRGATYEILTSTSTQFYVPSDSNLSIASTSVTTTVLGEKGPVSGNVRQDKLTTTSIVDGDLVARAQPQIAKVLIASPFKGMPIDQVAQQVFKRVGLPTE